MTTPFIDSPGSDPIDPPGATADGSPPGSPPRSGSGAEVGLLGRVRAGFSSVIDNPVLRREMDERARSSGSAIALTMWLLLLSGLTVLVYLGSLAGRDLDPVSSDLARTGRNLFEWTVFGMLVLILFMVPAFTSSSIAGERTRQTLVPVQMTTMGPVAIVLGKVLASVAFTVLLVVAAAPILAVGIFIGGVGIGDLVRGLGMLLATTVMLGSVGVMFSAVARRVQTATAATYGFVLLITVGSFVSLLVWVVVDSATSGFDNGAEAPPKELLAVNPLVGVADGLGGTESFGDNPMSGLRGLIDEIDRERTRGPDWFIEVEDDGPFPDPGFPGDVILEEPMVEEFEPIRVTALWRWYLVFLALTIYSAIYVATERIRTPAVTER